MVHYELFRVCFYFYCIVAGLSQLFNVSYHLVINLLFAAITVLSIYVTPNVSYLLHLDQTIWPTYTFVCGFALPLLLFVVLLIKRRFSKG